MIKKTMGLALCGALLFAPLEWAQAASAPQDDHAFLKMAAEADMTSAHIGEMAETRAASNGVKEFGRKLVQDHTDDYRQVAELAAKLGDSIPKGIDSVDNRQITRLGRFKGAAFDRAFLAHETVEHQRLVSAFKREAEHGNDPAVKAYAGKTLPALESHLHDGQDLLKAKKPHA
jgi:putative membrane protein